jgi:phage baseplate assembly protein W|tara:strand:- start:14149 stop:14586 length:438 start_codon:yes stop_codon:yes gene_type:complete
MSRKREEKKYHPLDLQKNIGVGIPLPLGGTPIFASTFTTEEQALSNLKNLLLTRKGERPFQPLFGTDVPSFLFENITKNLLDNLKAGLQKDIEFWLPYINIKEIIVDDLPNENRINISFSFSVGESGANQIIIVNVDEQGSLSIA